MAIKEHAEFVPLRRELHDGTTQVTTYMATFILGTPLSGQGHPADATWVWVQRKHAGAGRQFREVGKKHSPSAYQLRDGIARLEPLTWWNDDFSPIPRSP